MSRLLFVLLTMLALVPVARAREPKAGAEGGRAAEAHAETRSSDAPAVARPMEAPAVTRVSDANQADLQKRRDVLRQATRLQMEEAPTAARQLSAQERAELRQQLQQQRLELLK
jgi:hypothetical protein